MKPTSAAQIEGTTGPDGPARPASAEAPPTTVRDPEDPPNFDDKTDPGFADETDPSILVFPWDTSAAGA